MHVCILTLVDQILMTALHPAELTSMNIEKKTKCLFCFRVRMKKVWRIKSKLQEALRVLLSPFC